MGEHKAVLASPGSQEEQTFLTLLPLIERTLALIAFNHHLPADTRDEFRSYVFERLIENNYARLRKFDGRGTIEGFLRTVTSNLLRDFRNHAWGKWRPSRIAKRLGAVAVELEEYLVLKGFSFGDACHALATNHGVTLTETELAELAAKLPIRFRRRMAGEEALRDIPAPDTPERAVIDAEREALFEQAMAIVAAERAKLPTEDAVIVAYRFEDGRKVADIARILGLPQRALYDRIGALMRQLRMALEKAGIDTQRIRDILDED